MVMKAMKSEIFLASINLINKIAFIVIVFQLRLE